VLRIANDEVRPRHRGELRVLVAATRPAGLGQARAYLAADLLRRYAERSRLASSVVDFAPVSENDLREPIFDIGVRLAVQTWARAGETPDGALATSWIDVPPDAEEVKLGEEPLVVRLNLLGFEGDAAQALNHWRERVAQWSRSPSGAMSRTHTEAIGAAFANGLDVRSALRVLAELDADDSVPDGVKFETFAAADRMFGLDLARDIGK
jgi:hypothetical protein